MLDTKWTCGWQVGTIDLDMCMCVASSGNHHKPQPQVSDVHVGSKAAAPKKASVSYDSAADGLSLRLDWLSQPRLPFVLKQQ